MGHFIAFVVIALVMLFLGGLLLTAAFFILGIIAVVVTGVIAAIEELFRSRPQD